jgi:pilus assembly protein CpaE
VGLKPTAVFNWEPQLFHTAATNAAPIVEVGAKSKAAATMRELSQHVLGRADPAGKRTKFDLMNLFKKR